MQAKVIHVVIVNHQIQVYRMVSNWNELYIEQDLDVFFFKSIVLPMT